MLFNTAFLAAMVVLLTNLGSAAALPSGDAILIATNPGMIRPTRSGIENTLTL